jgi:hypothetical protein
MQIYRLGKTNRPIFVILKCNHTKTVFEKTLAKREVGPYRACHIEL